MNNYFIYIYIYNMFYKLTWDVMRIKKPADIKTKPNQINPN